MDADLQMIERAISEGWFMRVGGTLSRTVYLVPPSNWTDSTHTTTKDRYADLCVGIFDSADLAHRVVQRWNACQTVYEEHHLGNR